MRPWLSVILPVHDGERFLEATLASAAAERPEGVEFLVYDSGSDDGAARRIVEHYSERLNLQWHCTPHLKPWTSKTNLGVRSARADHVCMLHQDDIWLPSHLAMIRAALTAAPTAVMSIAPSRFIDASGKKMGSWRLPFRPGPVASSNFIATLLVQNSIAIPSPVIRRDAWLAVDGMDEALWYTADWDLYLRLAQHGAVFVRAAETTAFRLHRNSLTMTGRQDTRDFRAQLETVLDRHRDAMPVGKRKRSVRLARTSIDINCSLAKPNSKALMNVVASFLRLGPMAAAMYLYKSRILDRVMPRLRLSLAHGF